MRGSCSHPSRAEDTRVHGSQDFRQNFPTATHRTLKDLASTLTVPRGTWNSKPVSKSQYILRLFEGQSQAMVL